MNLGCWRLFIKVSLILPLAIFKNTYWSHDLLSSPLIGPLNKEQTAKTTSIPYTTMEEWALSKDFHGDYRKCSCGIANNKKIVSGTVAGLHEFPWMAFILTWKPNGLFLCGGSIITDRHVLTAGHCMDNADDNGTTLYLGGLDTWNPNNTILVNVSGYKVHPKYNTPPFHNDVAIITLNQPLKFNAIIRPICLPPNYYHNYVGKTATVAGWGKLGPSIFEFLSPQDGDWSRLLMKADVPIISNHDCQKGYQDEANISSQMICAGIQYDNGTVQDVCAGDSGGPLMITSGHRLQYTVIGTVSFGYKRSCGSVGVPGVYARVDHFLEFIRQNTRYGKKCPS